MLQELIYQGDFLQLRGSPRLVVSVDWLSVMVALVVRHAKMEGLKTNARGVVKCDDLVDCVHRTKWPLTMQPTGAEVVAAAAGAVASRQQHQGRVIITTKPLLTKAEWQPNRTGRCSICNFTFGRTISRWISSDSREYHCRACGRSVCNECGRYQLLYEYDQQVHRTCKICEGSQRGNLLERPAKGKDDPSLPVVLDTLRLLGLMAPLHSDDEHGSWIVPSKIDAKQHKLCRDAPQRAQPGHCALGFKWTLRRQRPLPPGFLSCLACRLAALWRRCEPFNFATHELVFRDESGGVVRVFHSDEKHQALVLTLIGPVSFVERWLAAVWNVIESELQQDQWGLIGSGEETSLILRHHVCSICVEQGRCRGNDCGSLDDAKTSELAKKRRCSFQRERRMFNIVSYEQLKETPHALELFLQANSASVTLFQKKQPRDVQQWNCKQVRKWFLLTCPGLVDLYFLRGSGEHLDGKALLRLTAQDLVREQVAWPALAQLLEARIRGLAGTAPASKSVGHLKQPMETDDGSQESKRSPWLQLQAVPVPASSSGPSASAHPSLPHGSLHVDSLHIRGDSKTVFFHVHKRSPWLQLHAVPLAACSSGPSASAQPPHPHGSLHTGGDTKTISASPRPLLSSASLPPLRILTLDGGGIRGLMEVLLLQDLLQRLNRLSGRPDGVLADYFDLMAGTSTGGMIALASGISRKPLSELEELYMTMGEQVFKGGSLLKAVGVVSDAAQYSADGLEKQLKRVFGEDRPLLTQRSQQAPTPGTCHVFVVAVSNRSKNPQPFLLRNWHEETKRHPLGTCQGKLWQAARATSAAPFYFPAFHHEASDHPLDDGGIYRNNPTCLALSEVQALWPGRELGCVASFGTGRPSLKPQDASIYGGEHKSLWQKVTSPVSSAASQGAARFQTLVSMATESHATHLDAEERLRETDRRVVRPNDIAPDNVYFRLDPQGEERRNLYLSYYLIVFACTKGCKQIYPAVRFLIITTLFCLLLVGGDVDLADCSAASLRALRDAADSYLRDHKNQLEKLAVRLHELTRRRGAA